MTRLVLALVALAMLIGWQAPPALAQSNDEPLPKVGLGVQFSFPAWGLSGKLNLNERVTAQGVFGLIGDLRMYGGRVLYHFNRREQSTVYAFGSLGGFSYKGLRFRDSDDPFDWTLEETTETVIGMGAGLGAEYFFSGLPEIGWNLEVGFTHVDFKEVDYNFSSIMIGVGSHYYF